MYEDFKTGHLNNFRVYHPLYCDELNGQLGLIKFETGNIPIVQANFVPPNTYSMLFDNERPKNTAKGVSHCEKNN